jgi:hypothetical protein
LNAWHLPTAVSPTVKQNEAAFLGLRNTPHQDWLINTGMSQPDPQKAIADRLASMPAADPARAHLEVIGSSAPVPRAQALRHYAAGGKWDPLGPRAGNPPRTPPDWARPNKP